MLDSYFFEEVEACLRKLGPELSLSTPILDTGASLATDSYCSKTSSHCRSSLFGCCKLPFLFVWLND